jgi:hypothetical protein
MAITRSLTFDKVIVNGVDLTPHLADSAEVTVEPVTQSVKNNQTLPSAYDISFSVDILNNNVVDNVSVAVYKDSTAEPVETYITFSAISGGATLNVTNVIITATPSFEGERVAYTLTGSKRVTNVGNTVTIT